MLRDYQIAAIEGLRNLYRENKKKPILVLPTGAGKTVVFTKIAYLMSNQMRDVLILVHRVELIKQTVAKLEAINVKHSVIHPDYERAPIRERVVVASVQTLSRNIPEDLIPDLIIIDEAHHATAKTYKKIIETIKPRWLLGVTATPSRLDGNGLADIFDSMFIGATIKELIEKNYLVKPRVFSTINIPDLSTVKKSRGDYQTDAIAQLFNTAKITGDAVQHYKQLANGKRAVVFCVNVKHADQVAQQFNDEGIAAKSINGELKPAERARAIQELTDGTIKILTSCEVISEGTDIPAVEVAILLRPTASQNLYLQQVGRVLRPAPGKDSAIILDHVGNCHRFGLPEEDRLWTLEHGAKQFQKIEIKTRTCQKCYAVFSITKNVCPECNDIYIPKLRKPIKTVDGVLFEVTAPDIKPPEEKKLVYKSLSEWKGIAQERGYSPGWAYHMFKWQQSKLTNKPAKRY